MVLPPNPDPESAEYMSNDELAKKYPDEKGVLADLSSSCSALGEVYRRQREFESALRFCDQALKIEQLLVTLDPGNCEIEADLALSYLTVAEILSRLGNDEMVQAYEEEAFAIIERLVDIGASNRSLQVKLSWYCSAAVIDLERCDKSAEASRYENLAERIRCRLDMSD